VTADLRRDPAAARWVAIAPGRATRPGAAVEIEDEDELESCPFCAGREGRTPPETLRLGNGPTGWDVRVVPNLYPALERQEVVVHGHAHRRSLGELEDETLELVAEAWQRRARDVGGTVFPIVNEGFVAGASLPHSHSQLAWLPGPPPGVLAEVDLPAVEPVIELEGLRAGCPHVSRVPYEVQIAPVEPQRHGLRSDLLGGALRLLAELVRRIHRAREGEPTPFNAWLHDGLHWHLELVPRTTRLAGLELGAGVFVNPLPPEEAAARLRAAGSR
jgi:UDPglucose--hexose-1-phosphate uridylyltransferase